MREFFVAAIILGVLVFGACGSKPADNEPTNTNANTESQFAHMTDANAALAEGKRLLDENQTELAIQALQQAVKLNPDLAEAYFQLGIAYSLYEMQLERSGAATGPASAKPNSQKAFETAVTAYKKWIEANPKDDVAFFNLGRTYAKLLKDEDAEEAFRQAVKLKPEDSEYQTELGTILIRLAKYHEAVGALKKALEIDPSNARAEELLEDAEAGRNRVNYVGPQNANQAANKASNSNANAASNSNSNSVPRPANANVRSPRETNTRPPVKPANRPN
jgi:Flp pilus assembly protein TadD